MNSKSKKAGIWDERLLEINEVILPPEHHTIWKPTVAGARSQNINGVTRFAGGVVGGKNTVQLGVLLLPNTKLMLSLQSVLSRFFGFQ